MKDMVLTLFGLIIFFLSTDDKVQVVPPQINPVFIRMPEKSQSGNLEDLPSDFFTALAQPQQTAQPISIPINVTTGTGKGKTTKTTKK